MHARNFKALRWALVLTLAASTGATRDVEVANPVAAPLPERMDLYVGDSRVLPVRTRRVAVGNGKVLTVSPVTSGQLVFIGQSVGSTVVNLWTSDGAQHRISVSVAANDVEAVLQNVRGLLGDIAGVTARISGARVVLEGDAADARARERAAAVSALHPGVVLDFVGKLGWESMIHFDVRIVEFRRGKLQELGIRWRDDVDGPSAGVIADFVSNDRFRVLPADSGVPATAFDPVPGNTSARAYLGIATTLDSRLRLLDQTGEATLVAEPRLSCRSGGSARFVAGGEIPVPIVNGVGATDVEYREYGVILDVKPIADASGAVHARVETELSQVDDAQRVAGVPGLLKRRSSTDINLKSGETLVIAGLTSRRSALDVAGLPGLSRLPFGDRLFGARSRRREESEMVIFLTPRVAAAPAETVAMLERGQARIDALVREGR